MKLDGFVKTASDEEVIRVAEGIRKSLVGHIETSVVPHLDKLAEEEKKKEGEPSEEEMAAAAAAAAVPTTVNQDVPAQYQGQTNEQMGNQKPTVDKKELEAALKEAIAAGNTKGIADIIVSLRDTIGEDIAANAISLARQIMQDLMVGGLIDKDQVASLAEAFTAFEKE